MAAVATSRPIPHGQRSPTLSDAGMILPALEADFARSFSPAPYIERPPSPPELYAASSHVKLSSAPQNRRRASHQKKSPSPSAQASPSTLRAMDDSEATPRRSPMRDQVLASSPTIHDALSSHPPGNWEAHDERRLSTASSSVLSEDLDNWPGFDSHDSFDDSGVDLEDQGKSSLLPGDADAGDDMETEHWPDKRNSGSDEDDDPYSSAALSRRAEIILANAKKRLNVMEGNLRGARESLVVSPTFSSTSTVTDLSQHISVARERDRRLYAGMGPIPPRVSSYRSSPLSANSSPGHSRGLSETSVPLPFTPTYMTRTTASKRASSAIGHASGPWSPETYGQGRFPIKESRSVEVLRDPRHTWSNTERENVGRSTSRSSKSPPALETLPEDEDGPRPHRSGSAASGLREQMNDLKGRISSLKLKAQEDHLRRRSLQSLRTPSPFTSADSWYSGTTAYQSGGSPITATAGLGIKTESPTRKALYDDDDDDDDEYEQQYSPTTTKSQHEGEKLVTYDVKEHTYMANSRSYPPQYGATAMTHATQPDAFEDEVEDETDDADFVSVDGDDFEAGTDSVYEDAVYEMPATERHEDRADAFDYEHFFLHSAMGTYSLDGRRNSTSSGSSTETTRPVTAVQTREELEGSEKRISIHQRNPSVDSVSTVASFATAAEHHSDDEEENEQMDQFSQHILANQISRPGTQNGFASLRSDSAINMRRANGASPTQTSISRNSTSPVELANGLQTSKIFTILTEASRDEPRLGLTEEETQLIYGLAASFQQVCANLQSPCGEAYDRKAWRRRLDEARRILNGEEDDDDQSF